MSWVVRNVDESGEGQFTVCWDPLVDGSSIVDNSWAVGTIMGIWPKSTGLIGAQGSHLFGGNLWTSNNCLGGLG
jgi:fructose-1,6-bisphosphatase